MLSLQEASEKLDVHPTTLRQWADRGLLPVYRTPGGHRRFDEADVRRLLVSEGAAQRVDLLVDAAAGRARRESTGGALDGEEWFRRLDGPARERYRELGRDLLEALRAELEAPSAVVPVPSARSLGARYAALAREAGLAVGEAMRGFLRFQSMVESGLDRRADGYLREVLIAMVEGYSN